MTEFERTRLGMKPQPVHIPRIAAAVLALAAGCDGPSAPEAPAKTYRVRFLGGTWVVVEAQWRWIS